MSNLIYTPDSEPYQAIAGLLRNGYSYRAIAEREGVSLATVHKIAKEVGIVRSSGTQRTITGAAADDVVRRRRDGEPMKSIAESYGVTDRTIYNVLVRAGEIRKKG